MVFTNQKNVLLIHAALWTDITCVLVSEGGQREKFAYGMIFSYDIPEGSKLQKQKTVSGNHWRGGSAK
jgi:hypothetical protein